MNQPRPFRFGVQLRAAATGGDWADLARRVSDLGYSTLTVPDHFGEQFAPVPALAVAATAAPGLRVGAFVFGNDYKHPVVLAKEMATLDLLTGGRVDVGLGAGWAEAEYVQAGIPFDAAPVRVGRLEESFEIVARLLEAAGPVTFRGRHYDIRDLTGYPAPVQKPRPPIMVGGAKPRVLRLAGRRADIVSFNLDLTDLTANTVDALTSRVGWVRDAAGDRFSDIELNLTAVRAVVTDDVESGAERAGGWLGLTPAQVLASPNFLVGPAGAVAEELLALRERCGISYVIVSGEASMDALAPVVERLAGS